MIEEHCAYALLAGARPRTVQVRKRVLRHFDRAHGLAAATRLDVLLFLSRDLSPQTRVSYLLHLHSYFSWQVTEGWRTEDPTVNVPRPRVPRSKPHPISDEHLALALTTAHEPLRSWFLLASQAGLRACEMSQIHGADLQGDMLYVRETKGGGSRWVPANAPVRACILAHGNPGRLWDVAEYRISARCNDWLHTRGIDSTLHKARHWAGKNILRAADGNVRVAQEFLGHASLNSTMLYTFVSGDQVRAAAERLPPAA